MEGVKSMFGKHMRLGILAVVVGALLIFSSSAQAGTVGLTSIIENWGSVDGSTPTIFQDDDRSVFLRAVTNPTTGAVTWAVVNPANVQQGDVALGWFGISYISYGNAAIDFNDGVPGIKTIGAGTGVNQSLLNPNYWSAVEGVLLASVADVSSGVVTLGNLSSSTSVTYAGVTVSGFDGIVRVYYDNVGDTFTGDDWSSAYAGVTDGAAVGVLADGDGLGTGTYYQIAFGTAGTTFEVSLDFLSAPTLMPTIKKNDLGTDVFAQGDIGGAVQGSEFSGDSQGTFKILFVPLPSAALPGLVMMAAIGFGAYRRRKVAQ
jgi:hypothetical protein